MAATRSTNTVPPERSYFDQQREVLINDIAINLENVLQNMNKLNRSLEGIIAVGNEFGQVEGLWSQFENVMAQQQQQNGEAANTREDTAGGSAGAADKEEALS